MLLYVERERKFLKNYSQTNESSIFCLCGKHSIRSKDSNVDETLTHRWPVCSVRNRNEKGTLLLVRINAFQLVKTSVTLWSRKATRCVANSVDILKQSVTKSLWHLNYLRFSFSFCLFALFFKILGYNLREKLIDISSDPLTGYRQFLLSWASRRVVSECIYLSWAVKTNKLDLALDIIKRQCKSQLVTLRLTTALHNKLQSWGLNCWVTVWYCWI